LRRSRLRFQGVARPNNRLPTYGHFCRKDGKGFQPTILVRPTANNPRRSLIIWGARAIRDEASSALPWLSLKTESSRGSGGHHPQNSGARTIAAHPSSGPQGNFRPQGGNRLDTLVNRSSSLTMLARGRRISAQTASFSDSGKCPSLAAPRLETRISFSIRGSFPRVRSERSARLMKLRN